MNNIKPHRISFDEAVKLIHDFLQQPTLRGLATRTSIGGIIHKESLHQQKSLAEFYGKMFWFCENPKTESKFPKIFLAFEDGAYDTSNVPSEPLNERLTYSKNIIQYNEGSFDEAAVREFLTKGFGRPTYHDEEISKADCASMLSHVANDETGKPYNRYFCSFFEYSGFLSDDYSRLISHPEVAYVAYLFGFDDSSKEYIESNRVRLILAGLDSAGVPIAQQTRGLNDDSGTMLQHTWPPPPPIR